MADSAGLVESCADLERGGLVEVLTWSIAGAGGELPEIERGRDLVEACAWSESPETWSGSLEIQAGRGLVEVLTWLPIAGASLFDFGEQ